MAFGRAGWAWVVAVGAIGVVDAIPVLDTYRLVPADGGDGDSFGYCVAAFGDLVLVGSPRNDESGEDSGAAYLFSRSNAWPPRKLIAPDAMPGDRFGTSIAVTSDLIVVGAVGVNGLTGRVYVFSGIGDFITHLDPSEPSEEDRFGTSVGCDGETIVIGSPGHDMSGVNAGAMYVVSVDAGYAMRRLLPPDLAPGDDFGRSVSVGWGRIAASAHLSDSLHLGQDCGAAYLFDSADCSLLTKLTASDGMAHDYFGWSVALGGAGLLVGAPRRGEQVGAAYLFDLDTLAESKLTPSASGSGHYFGKAVSADESALVVAAPGRAFAGGHRGTAFVFDRTGHELGEAWPSVITSGQDSGRFVAIADRLLVVGARTHDAAGAATVLELCTFDFDGSGQIDFGDLNILLDHWAMTVNPWRDGDMDGDGAVGFADLNAMLEWWAQPCFD